MRAWSNMRVQLTRQPNDVLDAVTVLVIGFVVTLLILYGRHF